MDGLSNVLGKRGLIFKISTWICTGLILVGSFMPYAEIGSRRVDLLDFVDAALQSLGAEGTQSYLLKYVLILLVMIALAIVVAFYEKASLAISIVLVSCSFVAGLCYLTLFSFMGEYAARQLKEYKSAGGIMMDVFFIILLVVSVVALVAEIYLKVSNQQSAVAVKNGPEWTCPQCGKSNVAVSKFCNQCGSTAPVSKNWFCPQCGAPNEATGKFCNKCGAKKPE